MCLGAAGLLVNSAGVSQGQLDHALAPARIAAYRKSVVISNGLQPSTFAGDDHQNAAPVVSPQKEDIQCRFT